MRVCLLLLLKYVGDREQTETAFWLTAVKAVNALLCKVPEGMVLLLEVNWCRISGYPGVVPHCLAGFLKLFAY